MGLMWRRVKTVAFLAVITLLLIPVAQASTLEKDTSHYQGSGRKIEIELRTRYHKVVYALITTTFYCADAAGHQYKERLRTYLGNKGLLQPNTRYAAIGAIPIRARGRFKFHVDARDQLLWVEDFFGRVGPRMISGGFRLHIGEEDSDCRTGGFSPNGELLSFQAHRASRDKDRLP
jgi:hypothetical protein